MGAANSQTVESQMNINAYRARTCGILLPWCLLINKNFPCWIFWGLEKDFVRQLSLTLRRRPFLIRQSVLLETYTVYLQFRRIYTTVKVWSTKLFQIVNPDFGWWQNRGSPPNLFSSNSYIHSRTAMISKCICFRNVIYNKVLLWGCPTALLIQTRCTHLWNSLFT